MTPQQHAARDRAVHLLRQIVRQYVPNLGEETRDQIRSDMEAVIDYLLADVIATEPAADDVEARTQTTAQPQKAAPFPYQPDPRD